MSIVPSSHTRITPAPAGNRFWDEKILIVVKDHPRPCGEQPPTKTDIFRVTGSPPPLRGTVKCYGSLLSGPGITPAPAGNRRRIVTNKGKSKDHPRPCGEQQFVDGFHVSFPGSPPPLRGTEYNTVSRQYHMRITPAPAGNRHGGILSPGRSQDHPRPCGEQQSRWISWHQN